MEERFTVQIRNLDQPKHPRVFDVVVDDAGNILWYELQNVRGPYRIDEISVKNQIREYLSRYAS